MNNKISVISISSTSNNPRLPPIQRPSRLRQKFERVLLLQSFSTTTFLLGYELSGLFIRIFSQDYALLSEEIRRFVFYTRISASSLLCFLVYLVGTPSIRRIIVEKVSSIYNSHSDVSTVLI
ncbi:unnamed protein product [Caenorhabditis sp. 36 PRJEB53466]|nr:unnamed protein product [Caenorhabditis sp. 36 PRJEB53466]